MRYLLLPLLLASCADVNIVSRRWIGPLTPATPGPACPATTGVAQITADRVIFTPDEGTWVLNGAMAPDGTIKAERTRPAADKQPYDTTLEAKRDGDEVTGTYRTPRCTYTVRLTRG